MIPVVIAVITIATRMVYWKSYGLTATCSLLSCVHVILHILVVLNGGSEWLRSQDIPNFNGLEASAECLSFQNK